MRSTPGERAVAAVGSVGSERSPTRLEALLAAARHLIATKGSTEFTVHEVVEQSQQSLRSFYQYFDGKLDLLLALFQEDAIALADTVQQVARPGDPLERLRAAVEYLYELSAPGWSSVRPVMAFAERLQLERPDEVASAYRPVLDVVTDLVAEAMAAGLVRPGRPRRMASIVLQAATVTARHVGPGRQPITAAEVWAFCHHALAPASLVPGPGSTPEKVHGA